MSEMRIKDYITRNRQLRSENRELKTLLGVKKSKSICFRFRCALREFFKEFYRV